MPQTTKTAFISYVSENVAAAEAVARVLSQNGITPWLDRSQLKAGQSWPDEIRKAIQAGSYFIPLFSNEWAQRTRSVANDELLIAIEELRYRPFNTGWIVPIKINDCEIPDIPVAPSRTLRSLHYIDFAGTSQVNGFRALLRALGVANPVLDGISESVHGWPFQIKIVRRDRYVDQFPVIYYLDDEVVANTAAESVLLNIARSGRRRLYCKMSSIKPKTIPTRSFQQGKYYLGKSDVITEDFLPSHRYELFVSCGDVMPIRVMSPYVELARLIKRKLTGTGVDVDDETTWTKIQAKLIRL